MYVWGWLHERPQSAILDLEAEALKQTAQFEAFSDLKLLLPQSIRFAWKSSQAFPEPELCGCLYKYMEPGVFLKRCL